MLKNLFYNSCTIIKKSVTNKECWNTPFLHYVIKKKYPPRTKNKIQWKYIEIRRPFNKNPFLSPNSNFCHCLFTNLRWGLNGEFGPTLRLKYKWLHTHLYLFKMTCYHILLKVKYLKLMRLIDIYENTILVAHLLVYNERKGVWWKLSHQNYTMYQTYKYRQY